MSESLHGLNYHAAYTMKPPYVVIRRWPSMIEPGDAEWFMGHKPRVWLAWMKAVPRWESKHLPTHEGLLRFPSEASAKAYINNHGDMKGQNLEVVHVQK